MWLAPLFAHAATTAEIKVRSTSFYVGTPFNFYVHVSGVKSAPQPDLLESDALEIRYVGAAPSSRDGEDSFTFTYEAMPLRSGIVTIPGGFVSIGDQEIPFSLAEIKVAEPAATDEMALEVELSHQECYVGQPVTLTFNWITNLSLNGVKAVNLRIPALTDYEFRVFEPAEPIDAKADNAIGVPISNQRVISEFFETHRNNKPAVRLTFRKIIVPTRAGELPLLMKPATLLCSYTEPRQNEFKGARYPSYFNNDFFDEEMVGEYQRLMVQGQPVTLKVNDLPEAGRPANFSGIVGAFTVKTSAAPVVLEVNNPVNLTVEAHGYSHPHLLEFPPFSALPALSHGFAVAGENSRPRLQDNVANFSQTVRPLRESVTAIPALEFSYFDPGTGNYGVARSEPIPITVNPASSANLLDTLFSDGSAMKIPVERQPGGIFANYMGPRLLVDRKPRAWVSHSFSWLLAWALPPLGFLALLFLTRNHRLARRDPNLARRRRAFGRFRFDLWRLGSDPKPDELSQVLKRYLQERFDVPHFASGAEELRSIAKKMDVDPDETDLLVGLIDSTSASGYSKHEIDPPLVGRQGLLQLVRKLEQQTRHAAAIALLILLSAPNLLAQGKESTLTEAEDYFRKGNAAAQVDPAQARKFYALAAERFNSLIRDHRVQNGELYTNLANTHFLSGDVGRAILNYRRAQRYLPGDRQLQNALDYARTQRVDIFVEGSASIAAKRVFFWHFLLSQQTRTIILACLAGGIWCVLGLHLLIPLRRRWNFIAVLGAAMLLVLASTALHGARNPSREGVIVEREVIARKGDSFIYDPAFATALHSGTEVRILEQRRDWLRIKTSDNSQGWIPLKSAERILPR